MDDKFFIKDDAKKENIFDRGISKNVDEKTVEKIGEKLKRRIEARKGKRGNPYMGFLFMGMVGWSFAVPFVLSLGLGVWLDSKFETSSVWTLNFLFIGLGLGLFNVFVWFKKELLIMNREKEEKEKSGS
ncbi:MAG: AtpZ/AtpI family protein [Alphaproteobacteria bacterium]